MVVGKKKYLLLILCVVVSGLVIVSSLPSSYGLFKINKEVTGSITVPENNYCINNGFNKLSDCMLVMENYADSLSKAKAYILSKGTPNFDNLAPTITYKEQSKLVHDDKGVIRSNNHFTLGKSYFFDKEKGMFNIKEYVNDELSDEYLNYYTCGNTTDTHTMCPIMYQIKSYTIVVNDTGLRTQLVTEAIRYTYDTIDALDSEIGLYATDDDGGSSYYYRGDVKNNYVSYAGFTWRIIRENGDGSVRLLYSGLSPTASGSGTSIKTSPFNPKNYDPTYVGYMYGEDFNLNTTLNSNTSYNKFNESTRFYFGSSYEFSDSTKKFSVIGDKTLGSWEDIHDEAIKNYPYTCFSTDGNASCNILFKVIGYKNSYTATVKPISYSSVDYDSTVQNNIDSAIKTEIDNWYESNILSKKDIYGNNFSKYLSDSIFCNDRSVYSGTGYLLSPTTVYGAYNRVNTIKKPSLRCSSRNDQFSTEVKNGNGNLTYPIGLMSIDEAYMAGGLPNAVNTKYYLYSGQTYYTMSPNRFIASSVVPNIWIINSTGSLNSVANNSSYAVRPVVNLSSEVLITGGDGTASNPYTVTLEK